MLVVEPPSHSSHTMVVTIQVGAGLSVHSVEVASVVHSVEVFSHSVQMVVVSVVVAVVVVE